MRIEERLVNGWHCGQSQRRMHQRRKAPLGFLVLDAAWRTGQAGLDQSWQGVEGDTEVEGKGRDAGHGISAQGMI